MNDIVSVIIPVYNVADKLERCLKSVSNQTYPYLEIIIVDDGSKDNSGKICDAWAEKDSRITVFHKENGGVSSARNVGINRATGKWITFIDGDDYLDIGTYEYLVNTANIGGGTRFVVQYITYIKKRKLLSVTIFAIMKRFPLILKYTKK